MSIGAGNIFQRKVFTIHSMDDIRIVLDAAICLEQDITLIGPSLSFSGLDWVCSMFADAREIMPKVDIILDCLDAPGLAILAINARADGVLAGKKIIDKLTPLADQQGVRLYAQAPVSLDLSQPLSWPSHTEKSPQDACRRWLE